MSSFQFPRLRRFIAGLFQERHQRCATSARQLPVLLGLGRRAGQVPRALLALPRLLGRNDDVPRHDRNVLLAKRGKRRRRRRVGRAERPLLIRLRRHHGELADAAHAGHLHEEAPMRAGHVLADLLVEARARLPAVSRVLDAEDDVKELDQGALPVAAAGELAPIAGTVAALVVEDAPGQAGGGHVAAAREKGPDAVVEDHGVAFLVHALEKLGDAVDAVVQLLEAVDDAGVVAGFDALEGRGHALQDAGGLGLHGNANEEKPRLGLSTSEADADFELGEVGEVVALAGKIPQVAAGIGENGWQLKMVCDFEEGNCYLRRENLVFRE